MPDERRRLRRLITGPVSPVTFHRAVITSVVLLIVIVPSGALVRLTGSGLGCPDWPGCHGSIVPPMQGHTIIEYGNRVLSAIVVVAAIVAYLLARRVAGTHPRLRTWALVAAASATAQAPLGGLTVYLDLHPLAVASHFLLSFVALGAGVATLMRAHDLRHGTVRRFDRGRQTVAGIMLGLLTAVIISGVLVTASGPHPGDPEVKIRFWNLADAVALHARVVLAFVICSVFFLLWLGKNGIGDRAVRPLSLVFAPMLIVQILVGEYQYRNQLPWEIILIHVTIVALLFTTAAAIAWLLGHPRASHEDADATARAPQGAAAPPDRQVSRT